MTFLLIKIMKHIIRTAIVTAFVLVVTSCTIYTEKQSEALSRMVYASKDSLDVARIDLTDKYVAETTRLVKPPKNRIKIDPIYKDTQHISVLGSNSNKNVVSVNKQRVVVIPEKYKNDTVVVVSSEEYQQLLKNKEVFAQIEKENQGLVEAKKYVDEELNRQLSNRDKMVEDLNIMQKKLIEKDLAILQRNIIIIGLLATIGGAVYLRIKGIL